jgi:hypothetical protein
MDSHQRVEHADLKGALRTTATENYRQPLRHHVLRHSIGADQDIGYRSATRSTSIFADNYAPDHRRCRSERLRR